MNIQMAMYKVTGKKIATIGNDVSCVCFMYIQEPPEMHTMEEDMRECLE